MAGCALYDRIDTAAGKLHRSLEGNLAGRKERP
jgi:hypothetical protein